VFISETITTASSGKPLPFVPIDPPTIQMEFAVNDGPLAGMEGQAGHRPPHSRTADQGNADQCALKVADTAAPNIFAVSGRGECKSPSSSSRCAAKVYEVLVSRPEVIYRQDKDGKLLEPIEKLFLEIPKEAMGDVLQNLAGRRVTSPP